MILLIRLFFRHLVVIIALSFVMPSSPLIFSTIDAHAQATEKKKKKNIFQIIFGRKKKKETKTKTVKRKKRSGTSKKTIVQVKKSENAQVVLVMGDFIANGLASGLTRAYQDNPNVVVVKETNGSSNLVKPGFYDWNTKSREWIEKHNPNIVIFNIGANDRQDMKIDGQIAKFKDDAWWDAYRKRVSTLALSLRSKGTHLIWVGVPSFKFSNMTADVLAFNGVYRDEVERVGGTFVDIWDGFVDENGKFIYTGSDINGQQVRLRSSDGINLTKAGQRKLAFYVEKPANRLLGTSNPFEFEFDNLGSGFTSIARPSQDPRLLKKTRVYAFSDPDLDGGDILLGGARSTHSFKEKSPLDLLLEGGDALKAPNGRVDHFKLDIADSQTTSSIKKSNKKIEGTEFQFPQ